jgi:hypothetical protein
MVIEGLTEADVCIEQIAHVQQQWNASDQEQKRNVRQFWFKRHRRMSFKIQRIWWSHGKNSLSVPYIEDSDLVV